MRRNWIKIYVDQCLRGTMMDEMQDPAERFVWFGFLLLAGDSAYEGKIALTEYIGYSDEQLGSMLKCNPILIKRAKKVMIKFNKIKILKNNVIQIVNWKKYQSEYQRQKPYRSDDGQKLLRKVTTKGNDTDRDKKENRNRIDKKKILNKENKDIEKEFEKFWEFFRSIGNSKDDMGDKPEALKAYKTLRKNESKETIAKATHGYDDFLKQKRLDDGFDQRKMYGSTFLRSKKWQRFIDFKYEPRL